MVLRAMNTDARQVAQSRLQQRLTHRLVRGCLTVPFDRQTLECIDQGEGFVRCAEELGSRFPLSKPALAQLTADLDAMMPRQRRLFR